MERVGLQELRKHASGLVGRVEAGEEIIVTVGGRPCARLVPMAPRTWRRWRDVAEVFDRFSDPSWSHDRELVVQELREP